MGERLYMVVVIPLQVRAYVGYDEQKARMWQKLAVLSFGSANVSFCSCVPDWEVEA